MLPGLTGHLVSAAFLEAHLPTLRTVETDRRIDRASFELIAWRRRRQMLGPASSLPTMLQIGATPLFAALGFDPPADVEPDERSIAATLRGGSSPTALLVASWDDRLDPFLRTAVTQAIVRSAPWC